MRPGHSPTKLTYADYVLFPDDGLRHEIIDGEHYVTLSPATRHQRIAGNLHYVLQHHLETHSIGEVFLAPVDMLLSDFDIVVPSLQGAADLVIEILSPSTRPRDERLKRELYERSGVEEYWLVDPDRDVIEVYQRSAAGFQDPVSYGKTDLLTTPLMPGLELPVDRILRNPSEQFD